MFEVQDKESSPGEMPDWSVIELDDIVWDDHIVPHPESNYLDDCAIQKGDCHKKKRKNADKSVLKDDVQERLGSSYRTVKDRKVSVLDEKGSWFQTPDDAFPDSCVTNCIKEMSGLASDDANISGNCFKNNDIDPLDNEFCQDISILGNSGASINGNLCHFSLGDVSPTTSDLELFSNDHMDKESNYLTCYGWPDIGNFEDVDRMFRSCDFTFGQENTANDDDLSWISSSSRAIGGSQEALKSGFKCSSSNLNTMKGTSQHHEDDMKLMPISATSGISDSSGNSYGNWLDTNTESNMVSLSNEQESEIDREVQVRTPPIAHDSNGSSAMVNLQSKQLKNHNQSEGKRKFHSLEYSSIDSFHNSGSPQQFANSMEKSSNRSPNAASMTLKENIKKISSRKDHEHKDLSGRAAFANPPPVQRQLRKGVGGNNEVEDNNEVEEVSTEFLAVEVDSSSKQGGSGMNSLLSDGIQPEATSFQQLQNVMEQLDIKTKLCIRDSLYRLARSAEQRSSFGNSNCCIRDGRDISGVMTSEESNKCTGFIDMETDTNPIDRSIAHLLFHKPSDPTDGALSMKSHTIIQGSVFSQPVMAEKIVCLEEVSGDADVKLAIPNTDQ